MFVSGLLVREAFVTEVTLGAVFANHRLQNFTLRSKKFEGPLHFFSRQKFFIFFCAPVNLFDVTLKLVVEFERRFADVTVEHRFEIVVVVFVSVAERRDVHPRVCRFVEVDFNDVAQVDSFGLELKKYILTSDQPTFAAVYKIVSKSETKDLLFDLLTKGRDYVVK